MADSSHDILARVEALVEPVLVGEGFELVDVQYRRERAGWVLRLFVDRAAPAAVGAEGLRPVGSGVTLDDCVEISREIGPLLDVAETIPGRYTLEVSSPGLDRPLKKPGDFEKYAGRLIRVRVSGPEGRRRIKGRLLGLDQGQIRLQVDDQLVAVPYEQAIRVQLEPELDWPRAS